MLIFGRNKIVQLTVICLSFFFVQAFAQTPKSPAYVDGGIYKSFEGFKSRKPDEIKSFVFENRTPKQIWGWGGTELSIKFDDKKIKKGFVKDSIWSVSTNDGFFVNNRLISVNHGFDKLLKLAYPVSYFIAYIILADENTERAAVMNAFGTIGGAKAAVPYKRVVAIDMRNGELIRMNEAGFLKLMKNDPDLLEKYKAIRDKKDNEDDVVRILVEYNERHQENR